MDWLAVSGKCVLLTGGAGGLGRAIAAEFLRAGAKVALIDRDAAGLEKVQAELCVEFAAGADRLVSYPCDLGDAKAVGEAVASLATSFAKPSILVNNAAMSAPSPLAELDLTRLEGQLRVNLIGCLAMAQAFRLHSQGEEHRVIVNVTSISGRNPQPMGGGYSMAKAALLMLNAQLAVEWGAEGIRSNAVSPGLFITPISAKFYVDPEAKRRREEVVPQRRIGQTQELADAVLYLASPRSSYINGEELIVDGGFSKTLMAHIPRAYSG